MKKNDINLEPVFQDRPTNLDNSIIDEPVLGSDLAEKSSIYDEPALGNISVNPLKHYPVATWTKSWFIVLLICLVSGIFSVASTFITTIFYNGAGSAGMSLILFGPAIEEFAKFLPILIVLERNPNLFRSPSQIILCGIISGFSFATIENVLYLNVYIDNPSAAITNWRLIVCTALHTICCLITGIGFAKGWIKFQQKPFRHWIHEVKYYLFTAIAVHCLYNFFAIFYNPQ